jgi:hypothetical protein
MTSPDLSTARGHLRNLATEMMERLDEFLGSHDEDIPMMIDTVSAALVEDMEDPESPTGEQSAARALRLMPRPEPEFWLTYLGRLISQRIGYGSPVVPRAHAAAILGISRQRVSQLEHAHGERHLQTAAPPEGQTSGVTNESVLRQLRAVSGRG